MPAVPANHIGLQLPQAFETSSSLAQIPPRDHSMAPTVHNPPPGPVKRSRTGTTKMRPSKSSTTPRWCIIFRFMGYSNNFF